LVEARTTLVVKPNWRNSLSVMTFIRLTSKSSQSQARAVSSGVPSTLADIDYLSGKTLKLLLSTGIIGSETHPIETMLRIGRQNL